MADEFDEAVFPLRKFIIRMYILCLYYMFSLYKIQSMYREGTEHIQSMYRVDTYKCLIIIWFVCRMSGDLFRAREDASK